MDESFALYDLKVEVVATEKPMVCSHKAGDYFLVEGENLVFPQTHSFSMYALSALLPMLPARQRPLDANDWMLSDSLIACPDPNCGARFKITRIRKRTFRHSDCTVVPAETAPAGEAAMERVPAEKVPEEKAPTKVVLAETVTVEKVPAEKTPTKKVPVKSRRIPYD